MKTLLQNVIITLFTGSVALAQPTLSSSGITPVLGDQLTIKYGNYLAPGTGGANQTWNFSAMTATSTTNYTVGTVASTPYASSFPNANLQMNDGSTYSFMNAIAGSLKIAGAYAGGVTFSYSDQEDILHFPFNMNDTYNDPFACNFTSSSVSFARSGSVTVTYDGYGTVTTPAGVFANAVRVHFLEKYNDVASFGTLTYTNDEYMWYVNGYHQPVAAVFSMTTASTFTTFVTAQGLYLSVPSSTVGLTEQYSNGNGIMAFPNPAIDASYISVKEDRIKTLEVYNINGRLVYSEVVPEGNAPVKVDVRDFEDGVYMARVVTANGKVQTKRINVVR